MKVLTKEEEQAHWQATVRGGLKGGFIGLAAAASGVMIAQKRSTSFRSLTLPLKAFLITSGGTFAAIVTADRASRGFEKSRHGESDYKDKTAQALEEARGSESTMQRIKDWGRENRYSIVTASWVASMGIALGLVGRNPYLSKQQKLVQARVYAQGLTLAVLVATAAFEIGDAKKGQGRWETVKIIDPNDPEHKHLIEKRIHHESYAGEDLWRDMVDAEEQKIKEREAAVKEQEEKDHKAHKTNHKQKVHKSTDKTDKKATEKS